MKIEDISIEEICRVQNIDKILSDLASDDWTKKDSAVRQLATNYSISKRKEIIYVLCGYYVVKIKGFAQIERFFDQLNFCYHIELFKLMLKDLAEIKDLYRNRCFIDSFISALHSAVYRIDNEDCIGELMNIIENSNWGQKLKDRFIKSLSI